MKKKNLNIAVIGGGNLGITAAAMVAITTKIKHPIGSIISPEADQELTKRIKLEDLVQEYDGPIPKSDFQDKDGNFHDAKIVITDPYKNMEDVLLWGQNGPTATHPIRTTAKVGRNEPCSCGKKKKFKKCCINKQ